MPKKKGSIKCEGPNEKQETRKTRKERKKRNEKERKEERNKERREENRGRKAQRKKGKKERKGKEIGLSLSTQRPGERTEDLIWLSARVPLYLLAG